MPVDMSRTQPMDDPDELIPDCEAGDGPSCFNLGLLYLEGAGGLDRDSARALDAFRRACALGVERGCTNREILATRLRGRAGDPATRAAWAAACEAGDGGACVDLGRALQGEGEAAAAAARYRQSCGADPRSSGGRACTDLGVLLLRGQPPDPALAASYFKRGCAGGDPAGCMNAARALYLGEGVGRDPTLARQYLDTACRGGSRAACSRLERLDQEP